MRKIKFRAWDSNKNYMAYQGSPDLENLKSFIFHFGDSELMQFTGLKDKAGTEIYEGDIVRWDNRSNGTSWRVAIVEINPDLQFRIVKIKCDFIQSGQEGKIFRFGRFIYKDTHNHLEVIGNVFDNPELLEK